MITKKAKKNKGFVILFAVTLSSILLAIALGVAEIALKEIKFSTSDKDTSDAFFATDTGVECALFNDKSTSAFPQSGGPTFIQCAGSTINFSASSPSWTFIVPMLGSAGQSCAQVSVTKTFSPDAPSTKIISKGYNIGSPSCDSTSSNLVERELDVNY